MTPEQIDTALEIEDTCRVVILTWLDWLSVERARDRSAPVEHAAGRHDGPERSGPHRRASEGLPAAKWATWGEGR